MYLSIFGVYSLLFRKYFEKFPESPLLALSHPGRRAGRLGLGRSGRLQKLQSARTPKKFRIIIPNTDANLLYVYNPRIDAIQFESFDRTNFEIFLN